MPTLLEYFLPENWIAQAIVTLLWFFFGIWMLWLISTASLVSRQTAKIQILNRMIPGLVRSRQDRDLRRRLGVTSEKSPAEEFRDQLPPGMAGQQPLVRHLESIYLAGCAGSRLDIRELLGHTERSITRGDSSLRSFLSIFLIFGLLGTLFGLADSIVALLALLRQNADAASNMVALLGALKGAFAPSISGVLTSVLGTAAYAIYQRGPLASLSEGLREATLNLWVPQSYPTTDQMAAEAAQRSLDAAVKVMGAAEHIREDTVSLAETLKSAATDTKGFAQGMTGLTAIIQNGLQPAASILHNLSLQIDRFDEAAKRWAAFDQTLGVLYTNLSTGQKSITDQNEQMRKQSEQQATQLAGVSQKLVDAHTQVFNKVEASYGQMASRMEGLQVPFKDAVVQMLDQVEMLRRFSETVLTNSERSLSSLTEKLTPLGTIDSRTDKIFETIGSLVRQQTETTKALLELKSGASGEILNNALKDQIALLREIRDHTGSLGSRPDSGERQELRRDAPERGNRETATPALAVPTEGFRENTKLLNEIRDRIDRVAAPGPAAAEFREILRDQTALLRDLRDLIARIPTAQRVLAATVTTNMEPLPTLGKRFSYPDQPALRSTFSFGRIPSWFRRVFRFGKGSS